MRVLILTNVFDSSEGGATTYRLGAELLNSGHAVAITTPGRFAYNPSGEIIAQCRRARGESYKSSEGFLEALREGHALETWESVDNFDVVLLRNNPSVQMPWAQDAAIDFGRLVMDRGVIVLNHPLGLGRAMNKLYLETFPESVRPRTLITRDHRQIQDFAEEQGKVILKPLQGSGGKGVFVLRATDRANVEQIIQSISRDGYVIAQEYLTAAAQGDTRLFLLNGIPLRHRGKYAAFRRVGSGADVRSNIHAGGKIRRAVVDDAMIRVAEVVRPRLVADGMFLVGLDVVGDKLMEINVFSPGGFGSAEKLERVDFTRAVIEALERKVRYREYYGRNFDNAELCTL